MPLRNRLLRVVLPGIFVALASTSLAVQPAVADVPACFIQPPVARATIAAPPDTNEVSCKWLSKLVQASDETQLAWIPGAVLNRMLSPEVDAFPDSAYAVRFVVTKQFNETFIDSDSLIRFAPDDFAARVGSWWTILGAVSDSLGRLNDKAIIKAKLALPASSIPNVEAVASEVRVGTIGYFGLTAPAFGQPGGAVQFWFPTEPVRSSAKTL